MGVTETFHTSNKDNSANWCFSTNKHYSTQYKKIIIFNYNLIIYECILLLIDSISQWSADEFTETISTALQLFQLLHPSTKNNRANIPCPRFLKYFSRQMNKKPFFEFLFLIVTFDLINCFIPVVIRTKTFMTITSV